MSVTNLSTSHDTPFNWGQFGRNTLLWLIWLWVFAPIFPYLRNIFSMQDFRTNQIILIAILAMIGMRVQQKSWNLSLDAPPRPSKLPLTITILSAIFFWLGERWLDINVISATLFILGSYGLTGLWLENGRWRRGLPVALLLAGTLPINGHLQTFVGYPLRIGTAALVRDGLVWLGVGSVSIDTILVLENGMTHIAVPCSGVQSLWTGSMFLLAITWLEDKQLNGRWVAIAAVLFGVLIASNFVRVFALVLTGTVWGEPLIADMLHVPLGVLGFVLSCGLALVLLRRLPPRQSQQKTAVLPPPTQNTLPSWWSWGLITLCVTLAVTYQSNIRNAPLQPAPEWPFSDAFQLTPDPLDELFWDWLVRDGATAAERLSFQYTHNNSSLSGSMLFVISDTWHAHHNPERCFVGDGLGIVKSETMWVEAGFPVNLIQLSTPSGGELSAVYWYQSPDLTTDDYATRIWSDIGLSRNQWTLVTILFDQSVDWQTAETEQMLIDLHNTVAETQK